MAMGAVKGQAGAVIAGVVRDLVRVLRPVDSPDLDDVGVGHLPRSLEDIREQRRYSAEHHRECDQAGDGVPPPASKTQSLCDDREIAHHPPACPKIGALRSSCDAFIKMRRAGRFRYGEGRRRRQSQATLFVRLNADEINITLRRRAGPGRHDPFLSARAWTSISALGAPTAPKNTLGKRQAIVLSIGAAKNCQPYQVSRRKPEPNQEHGIKAVRRSSVIWSVGRAFGKPWETAIFRRVANPLRLAGVAIATVPAPRLGTVQR